MRVSSKTIEKTSTNLLYLINACTSQMSFMAQSHRQTEKKGRADGFLADWICLVIYVSKKKEGYLSISVIKTDPIRGSDLRLSDKRLYRILFDETKRL